MFTISKEAVPLSDPGGVGQCGDRCTGVLSGRPPSDQRSGTDSLSYSAPKGWDFCGLFPSCCRQGNPYEFYISWQKLLTPKGVRAWRPPFGEAELLLEASRSSVSPLGTLVWNAPINKL